MHELSKNVNCISQIVMSKRQIDKPTNQTPIRFWIRKRFPIGQCERMIQRKRHVDWLGSKKASISNNVQRILALTEKKNPLHSEPLLHPRNILGHRGPLCGNKSANVL